MYNCNTSNVIAFYSSWCCSCIWFKRLPGLQLLPWQQYILHWPNVLLTMSACKMKLPFSVCACKWVRFLLFSKVNCVSKSAWDIDTMQTDRPVCQSFLSFVSSIKNLDNHLHRNFLPSFKLQSPRWQTVPGIQKLLFCLRLSRILLSVFSFCNIWQLSFDFLFTILFIWMIFQTQFQFHCLSDAELLVYICMSVTMNM